MGMLLYVFFIDISLIPIIIVSVACLSRCKGSRAKKARDWFKKKQDAIFFNAILTFVDATLIVVLLAATINIQSQKGEKNFSYYFAIVCLAICFL